MDKELDHRSWRAMIDDFNCSSNYGVLFFTLVAKMHAIILGRLQLGEDRGTRCIGYLSIGMSLELIGWGGFYCRRRAH